MQFPEENSDLLKSLAKARDNRRWWQKLDQWVEERIWWLVAVGFIAGALAVVHHWNTFQ